MNEHGTLQLRRYKILIERLGEEAGYPRGWKTAVAKRLGISPSYLTKVLRGDVKDIGGDVIDRALNALDMDGGYFFDEKVPSKGFDYKYYLRSSIRERSQQRERYTGGRLLGGAKIEPKKLTDEQWEFVDQWYETMGPLMKVVSSVRFVKTEGTELVEPTVDREAAKELAKSVLRLALFSRSIRLLADADALSDGRFAMATFAIVRPLQDLTAFVLQGYLGADPHDLEALTPEQAAKQYEELGIQRSPESRIIHRKRPSPRQNDS